MKKIKGKNGKFLASMLLLGLVFCFRMNAKAETMDPPTEEDVYVHGLDEGYVDNVYKRAVVLDKVVYQYMPEEDSYRIVAFDDNDGNFPEGIIFKPRSEVRGKPVTEIYSYDDEDGTPYVGRINLVLPDSIQKIDLTGSCFASITLPSFIKPENMCITEYSSFDRIYFPKTAVSVGGILMTTQLTGFDLPASVKTIEKDFMWDSLDLRAVYIPQGVKTIGEKAFAGCENLEIYVPSSVKKNREKGIWKRNRW